VVLAHQLFGLTADVRAAADRIASLGYAVVAPDFFHRSEQAVVLPVTDEGRTRGFALMGQLTREGVLADVRAAISYLDVPRVGIVGLSMGGHLAWYAATQLDLAVTVALYADRLAADGVRHDMLVLPGAGHAFLAEGTPSYDEAAAGTAWQVITDVLAAELQ
jgi:carboxymethylenebutenolidase